MELETPLLMEAFLPSHIETIEEHRIQSSLQFTYVDGYEFQANVLPENGIKLELLYSNESAAVLMPFETAINFGRWLRKASKMKEIRKRKRGKEAVCKIQS